ncbi:DUF222 domain-containing protein [Isoptericola cucumis]|uniref:HNH endonuclease signature motif containing protein n=1 Tax=Isoptericola cucumis TaxID=1776856 RepID=UPI00320A4BF2
MEALSEIAANAGWDHVPDPDLAQVESRLRAVEQRLAAVRLDILPALEDSGTWSLDGSRTFAHWLARRDRVHPATAHREVRTARRLLHDLPATRAAALAGQIGADHVRALVDVAPTSPARRETLAAPVPDPTVGTERDAADVEDPDEGGALERPTGEEYLLSLSEACSVPQFRRLVGRFAHVADPEADERGYVKAREKEFLEVSPTFDGYHLAGFLTEEHGQTLRGTLDALTGPPTGGDTRTPTQRRAQALADMARLTAERGDTRQDHTGQEAAGREAAGREAAGRENGGLGRAGHRAASRPHVTVTVSWTELRRALAGTATAGTATDGSETDCSRADCSRADNLDLESLTAPVGEGLARFGDGRGPIPASVLRRIACDGALTRVIFGPDSQVLDVGRAQRTVAGPLRRAVVARDQHCTFPGCDEPPSRCEVHHAVVHWADGGPTSAENAALLCWHHHDHVDGTGVTMRRRARAGTSWWEFRDRQGRALAGSDVPPGHAPPRPAAPGHPTPDRRALDRPTPDRAAADRAAA